MLFKDFFNGLRKNENLVEEVKETNIENNEESIKVGPVITIAREFGSGGREIAIKLSQRLNYDFYDKEKIIEAAKQKGIDTELFEQLDEKKMDSFWINVSPKDYDIQEKADTYEQRVNNDKMFMIQSDAIRTLAQKGNAVFVGRCASYILKNQAKKVFITAGIEDKIKRVEKRYDLARNRAINLIKIADEKREKYYDYYTNTKWNAPENYDLVIDVSKTGIDGAVDKIVQFINGD